MGTSGTFGGSKNGLVPSWVGEPPSQPAAAPADGGDGAADGQGDGGQDDGNAAPANPTKYPPIPSVSPSSGLGPARGDVTRGTRTSDFVQFVVVQESTSARVAEAAQRQIGCQILGR